MRYIIAALAVGFTLAVSAVALSASTIASDGVQVAAQTSVAAALSGRVVDAQSHAPLANVKITAYPQGSTVAEASAMTDIHGQFTLAGLRGGDYRLLFERPGYPKSLAGGIGVKPHDHLVLISSFALQSTQRSPQLRLVDPCGSLLQPGQVADVYVICSGH
jgi:hypothetical protein